jgi:hypothetical protein
MLDQDGAFMIEDIDYESWQVRQVYAKFGLAIYHGQVLEHGIVNLLVWSGVTDGRYSSYAETETESAELFSRTMGFLKKLLIDRSIDITDLDDDLIRAVRLRNFLAHDYFRERASAFLTNEGRERMLIELDQAVSFLSEIDARLDPLTLKLVESLGLVDNMPKAMEAAEQAGFGQSLPGL